MVWRWDSDPFGESAANEDPDGDTNTVTVNLRFPGQYLDVETDLYYNYFRDDEPNTGRSYHPLVSVGSLDASQLNFFQLKTES